MESFYNLMCVFGDTSVDDDVLESCKVDIVSRLPPEIATKILRLLPGKDLASAATVNKTWLKLCRYDRLVRKRIHSHLKLHRKYKMRNLSSIRHTFNTPERAKPFSSVFNCIRQGSKHQRTDGISAVPAVGMRKNDADGPNQFNGRYDVNQNVRGRPSNIRF